MYCFYFCRLVFSLLSVGRRFNRRILTCLSENGKNYFSRQRIQFCVVICLKVVQFFGVFLVKKIKEVVGTKSVIFFNLVSIFHILWCFFFRFRCEILCLHVPFCLVSGFIEIVKILSNVMYQLVKHF